MYSAKLVLGVDGGEQLAVQLHRYTHVVGLHAVVLADKRTDDRLEGAEQHTVHTVAGGLRQPVVELIKRVGRVAALFEHIHAGGHFGKGVFIDVGTGQPGALRFDQQAKVHHVGKNGAIQLSGIVTHQRCQRLRRGAFAIIAHHRAAAGANAEKAHALQLQETLVHAAARHAQHGGKLTLRRQMVTRLQLAGEDLTHNDLSAVFLQSRRVQS